MSGGIDLITMTPDPIRLRVEWLLARYYEAKIAPFYDGKPDAWSRSRKAWPPFAGRISPHEAQLLSVVKGFVREPIALPLWKYAKPSFDEAVVILELFDSVIRHYLAPDDLCRHLVSAQNDEHIGHVPDDAMKLVCDAVCLGQRRPGELLIDTVGRLLRPWTVRFQVDWDLPFRLSELLSDTIYHRILDSLDAGVPAAPSGCEALP